MVKTQIEWLCREHDMNRIWISAGDAICLQCAVEALGFRAVSDLLKETKTIS